MGSNRDWGVPGFTLTLPPGAGPDDPQLRIGEPPSLLVAFYAAAPVAATLSGALIFQTSANVYWYQVNGTTISSGFPMVAFGFVDGATTADVHEQWYTAKSSIGSPLTQWGTNGGGGGTGKKPLLRIGGTTATSAALFDLADYSRADFRELSTLALSGTVFGSSTMQLQAFNVPVANVGMGAGYVTTDAVTGAGFHLWVPQVYNQCRMFRIRMVGAGGSGGGTAATAAGQAATAAGGGSGEYVEAWIPASAFGAFTFDITIGTGGAATAAGANNGTAGSATSLSINGVVQLSANGGGGGEGAVSSAGNVATQGGTPGTGGTTGPMVVGSVIRVPGSDGGPGMQTGGLATMAGLGAASLFGGWTRPSAANSGGAGITARNYGCGSSGAWAQAGQGAFGAGAGSDGVAFIDVFM